MNRDEKPFVGEIHPIHIKAFENYLYNKELINLQSKEIDLKISTLEKEKEKETRNKIISAFKSAIRSTVDEDTMRMILDRVELECLKQGNDIWTTLLYEV